MDKCFLFTQYLEDTGCLCLKMSGTGELVAPPAQRSFAEIKSLQEECDTLIVESAANTSLFELELPWLPERKARIALPFALEDKVAQPIDELHFSFDKARYQNNRYLVVVISKQRIQFIMHTLDANNIKYDAITLDWFALSKDESIVIESNLLVNNEAFKGVLSEEIALNYLKKPVLNEVLHFQDSKIKIENTIPIMTELSYTWIAKRLNQIKSFNLCQGDMQHEGTSDWIKKGYQLTGVLCCFWLLSILLTNAISLYGLNKQNEQLDKQIATIYHEFFPEAKQVISPKFRISQLLGNQANENQTRFWFLLNQLAKVMNQQQDKIENLRYQNKVLLVTLVSADFASLENIENKLRQLQLNVKQTQASTREQQVIATLELT